MIKFHFLILSIIHMSCLTYNNLSCWPNVIPCPNIIYAASVGTAIPVVSGGTSIPVGTYIPPASTTVPANTVTVITPFLNLTSFSGGIVVNNGFFTVPLDGQYLVTAVANFSNTSILLSDGDYRELYIYKVNFHSQPQGLVTLVAKSNTVPVLPFSASDTDLSLSYIVDLRANDRIFIAATQLTQAGSTTNNNLSANTRVAIRRLL